MLSTGSNGESKEGERRLEGRQEGERRGLFHPELWKRGRPSAAQGPLLPRSNQSLIDTIRKSRTGWKRLLLRLREGNLHAKLLETQAGPEQPG